MSENKDTPVMFAREHTLKIREMLTQAGAKPLCPRCNEELTVSGPVSAGEAIGPVFHVVCGPCRRHAAIRDVPGDHVVLNPDDA